jgi:hypothetical protein
MNEDRYLYCETITGEWWYKDMKTGEDLPMYSTPIYRPTIEELNEECSSLYNKCKYLQSKIDKAVEYIDNNSHYFATDTNEIGFVIEEEKEEIFCKELLDILKEDK